MLTRRTLLFLTDLLIRVNIDPSLPPDELEQLAHTIADARRQVVAALAETLDDVDELEP